MSRSLIPWEPFREVESLQQEMNRLFDSLAPTRRTAAERFDFMPAAELHETEDAIELRLEAPGMEADDLDVSVSAEAVAISGERRSESRTEENGTTRSEFRYGKFQRVIPLPSRVQNDSVSAEYKNGILRLSLPKAESEKNKVVKVNVS
ncbi:MAG: Hsp20/alpha crystallin family protein [Cyanobacteriota bacterium]|nr:Hsp20/alpha crystallin family protein [Cyanobacteriota bacterium]